LCWKCHENVDILVEIGNDVRLETTAYFNLDQRAYIWISLKILHGLSVNIRRITHKIGHLKLCSCILNEAKLLGDLLILLPIK